MGYWLAASGRGIFTYGDAPLDGSMGGTDITDAIGIATSPCHPQPGISATHRRCQPPGPTESNKQLFPVYRIRTDFRRAR